MLVIILESGSVLATRFSLSVIKVPNQRNIHMTKLDVQGHHQKLYHLSG